MLLEDARVTDVHCHGFRLEAEGKVIAFSGDTEWTNALIDIGYEIGARWMTLEVRVSNEPAKALYHKYGFKIVSTRPRYYSDNNEDAYIMWTDEITLPDYRRMFADHKARLFARLAQDAPVAG